jgi:hypothetical protein
LKSSAPVSKKKFSRKGAGGQRKARKEQTAFNAFAFFLGAFAPLRETFFYLAREANLHESSHAPPP